MAPDSFVVAIVLTYRRTALLRGCLDAILGQTRPPDLVVVVDNDALARDIAAGDAGVKVVQTGENLGPAGGYALGFRLALEHGADKIWTVDDDVEPRADCLERLLDASRQRSIALPLQLKPDRVRGYPPSWNGGLFDAEAVREIGVPDARLFFWAEDTEYFLRASRAGIGRIRVPEAVVMHLNPEDRVRGQRRDWRLYYEVRNSLHFRLRVCKPGLRHWYRACQVAAGKPVAIIIGEPGKGASLRLWWWGLRDFFAGRLGKVVDPETWKG